MITEQAAMDNTISQQVNGFTRHLAMRPPFDRRHSDPAKNYGIHGVDLLMVLAKDGRAVHFVAYLPVHLPHVADFLVARAKQDYNPFRGMGADVGYHSPVPMYEKQPCTDDCQWIGGKCYGDGSARRADEWYQEWLEHGNEHIWRKLERDWEERFGGSIHAD